MSRLLAVCQGAARVHGSGERTVVALHHTDCAVGAGDRVAVTGPSGSGKSTLLHLLAGIDMPTSGSVTWPALGGRAALRPGPVALVLQGPSLLAPLDVLENVALPLLLAGVDGAEAEERALQALTALRLEGLASRLPDELSGGQAQRVAVARALAGRPRLILADEPTGQLDAESAATVLDLIDEVVERLGAACVVTTHDERVAHRLPLRWSMRDGRLDTGAAPC